jgi:hypothetical protein
MGEEKWVYGYDVETKKPLLKMGLKNISQNQKSGHVQSKLKVMLTVYFVCLWRCCKP